MPTKKPLNCWETLSCDEFAAHWDGDPSAGCATEAAAAADCLE